MAHKLSARRCRPIASPRSAARARLLKGQVLFLDRLMEHLRNEGRD